MEKVRWWIPAANKAFNLCIELKSTFAALALDIILINNYCNHHITRPCRQISALGYWTGRSAGQHPFHSVTVQRAEKEWPTPASSKKDRKLQAGLLEGQGANQRADSPADRVIMYPTKEHPGFKGMA